MKCQRNMKQTNNYVWNLRSYNAQEKSKLKYVDSKKS